MLTPEFLIIAFIGGLLTFFSPCIAPLMPGYLTFIAGTSLNDNSAQARRSALLTALAFVLGLATVFSVMGAILTVFLTGASASIGRVLEIIGGSLIIAFGILMSGLFRIPFLEREIKWHPQKGKNKYPTAFVFGAAFGIGWTPCVGAILGAILTLAVVEPSSAFPLLFAFSLGMGIPFIVLSLFIEPMSTFIKRSRKAFKIINLIASVILIILGIMLITGDFQRIAAQHAALPAMGWADDLQDWLITLLVGSNEAIRERGIVPHECDPTIMDCPDEPGG